MAVDRLSMQFYSSLHPRGPHVQGIQFYLGNPGYDQKRFGPMIPETSVVMRDKTAVQVLMAFGVSPKVLDGDGQGQREARRSLYLDTILPLSALISQELSVKLDSNIVLDFNPSQYRDYQRLSRSLKTFIDAGLSLAQATTLLGIPTPTPGTAASQRSDTGLRVRHMVGDTVVQEHDSDSPCELCRQERESTNGLVEHATL